MPEFTKTQCAILLLLNDGEPHHKDDVKGCLDDPLASISAMQMHLAQIRKKLRPIGQDIVCILKNRQTHYRHIRSLGNSE